MKTELGPITDRPYQGDADFWAVRQLLQDTYSLVPTDFNWEIRRWDGWHYHAREPHRPEDLAAKIHLWEADGQIIGAVHPEDGSDAFIEVHPAYRHLIEADMFAWAEGNLAGDNPDGPGKLLKVFPFAYDTQRLITLKARGYEKQPWGGITYKMRMAHQPLQARFAVDGYTLRATEPDNMDDCQGVAEVLNGAFKHDGNTAEFIHRGNTTLPCFRHDLDLVAIADDGTYGAYVGMLWDEQNKMGRFEPVATHPDHQRRGLARALMVEGLHRMNALGAVDVLVGTGLTGMDPANRLYEAIGFTEGHICYGWTKKID